MSGSVFDPDKTVKSGFFIRFSNTSQFPHKKGKDLDLSAGASPEDANQGEASGTRTDASDFYLTKHLGFTRGVQNNDQF